MRLAKIDLRNIVAIGHDNDRLGLLIDRGEAIEYLELPAPRAAYDGLQVVAAVAENEIPVLPESSESPQLPSKRQAIAMLPVASKMATAIGYNESEQRLQVEFKNGSVYQYSDVDGETWQALQNAESTGKFFNQEIKGTYRCDRLDLRSQNIG